MKSILQRHFDDILMLGGCALILYGTYLVNQLMVWFVGGMMLIVFGILVGMGAKE